MANILQVNSTSASVDNRIGAGMPQMPAGTSRVTGAEGNASARTGETNGQEYSVIDFESNYGAFIQRLRESTELSTLFEMLLSSDMVELNEQIETFFASTRMNSPEELLNFIKGQNGLQTKFTGSFFDSLRKLLAQSPSEGLKEAAMTFLRGYNDYSSGQHLLTQMHTLTDDISRLMLRHYREEFTQLADTMNWNAGNGDTAYNTSVVNGRLIPFLSSYISRTHDYGAVREAIMMFVFHAVRYENGDSEQLNKYFERMMGYRDFDRFFKGDVQKELSNAFETLEIQEEQKGYADTLTELLSKGSRGQGGMEHIPKFYSILNNVLLNESVYMPLIHLMLPFQYQGKQVMSELWIDPDCKRDTEHKARKVKVFLKFNIQNLGKFELLINLQDRQADMQISVPSALIEQSDAIRSRLGEILKSNGLGLKQLFVSERVREGSIEEIFPEIRRGEKSIDVRI